MLIRIIKTDKQNNIKSSYTFIPQGMVDNNLYSDRISGPKPLDPYYYTQPIDFTIFVRKSLLCIVMSCTNVLSYETVWDGNQTHYLPNTKRMRYESDYSCGLKQLQSSQAQFSLIGGIPYTAHVIIYVFIASYYRQLSVAIKIVCYSMLYMIVQSG